MASNEPGKKEQRGWRLFRRREATVPTWRGWLLIFLIVAFLGLVVTRCIYPFLAIDRPVIGGLLVVEGWAPDYVLQAAVDEFRQGNYGRVYVTGGPLEVGAPLSEHQNFATLGASTLRKLGLASHSVETVPAPAVAQDRTFASAVALKRWWSSHDITPLKVQIVSHGPHARRSRLLYEKVFGKGVTIGILSIPPRDYDPKRWWRSSAGFRTVTGEIIAYLYARLIFTGDEAAIPAGEPASRAVVPVVRAQLVAGSASISAPPGICRQWPADCTRPG